MKIKTFLLTLSILLFSNNTVLAQAVDYSNDKTYKELYNAMHRAFNDGDSTKFFPAIQALQKYFTIKMTCMATIPSAAMRSCSR